MENLRMLSLLCIHPLCVYTTRKCYLSQNTKHTCYKEQKVHENSFPDHVALLQLRGQVDLEHKTHFRCLVKSESAI